MVPRFLFYRLLHSTYFYIDLENKDKKAFRTMKSEWFNKDFRCLIVFQRDVITFDIQVDYI